MMLRKNGIIVFQGDSVTDAGRTREMEATGREDCLGQGYPAMTAGVLRALYPELNLKFYNRGVNGDRVENLLARWSEDTIELHPTLVTLLIGVNNVWHPYVDGDIPYNIVRYEQDLTRIVEQTLKTGAKLIIMEPFAFHHDVFPPRWRGRLSEVQQVVRRIAIRYADAFIPLDGILYREAIRIGGTDDLSGAARLSADGVHPTVEGHRIIAAELLRTITE